MKKIKNKCQVNFEEMVSLILDKVVARRGAHLAAERSELERSGAKWRVRGLGQRNFF